MSQCQFIENERTSYPVRLLCRVLDVPPARYYSWRKAATSACPTPEPAAWEEELKKVFTHHQKRYGT